MGECDHFVGLEIKENFITPEEEELILSWIKPGIPKSIRERNSIRRFGSNKPYNSSIVSNLIPQEWNFVLERLVAEGVFTTKPDSLTINEYFTGQAIAPHIDSPMSGPIIAVLSLKSPAEMVFEKPKETSRKFLLEPRSLVAMREKVRYDWKHSILPVMSTRYSIVFRHSQ